METKSEKERYEHSAVDVTQSSRKDKSLQDLPKESVEISSIKRTRNGPYTGSLLG